MINETIALSRQGGDNIQTVDLEGNLNLIIADTSIWKQMIFDGYGVTIKKMNDSCRVYSRKVDTMAHTLKIRPYNWTFYNYDTLHKSDWRYEKKGELLSLNGNYNGDSVQVLLKWYDHNEIRLPSW